MRVAILNKYRVVLAFAVLPLLASTCKEKDDEQPDTTSGNLTLEIIHYFDGMGYFRKNLTYDAGDSNRVNISNFQYYLSNLKLRDGAGRIVFTDTTRKYYLVVPNEQGIYTSTLPYTIRGGSFSEIEISLGIDSFANHTLAAQRGDLVSNNGMSWGWTSGYKFMLMEGSYNTLPDSSGTLVWHVGFDNNFRKVTFPLATPVLAGKNLKISLNATLKKLFVNVHDLRPLYQNNGIHFDTAKARRVADNYSRDFLTLEGVTR